MPLGMAEAALIKANAVPEVQGNKSDILPWWGWLATGGFAGMLVLAILLWI